MTTQVFDFVRTLCTMVVAAFILIGLAGLATKGGVHAY